MADSKGVVKESDIKLNPLQVMSAGTPSAQMTGLANVWNVASTPLMNKEGKAEDVANANDKNNIKFELQFLKYKLKEIGP